MSDLIARLLENWTAWGSPTNRAECINEKLMAMDCKDAADALDELKHERDAYKKALQAHAQHLQNCVDSQILEYRAEVENSARKDAEITRLRAENKLLNEVVNRARAALLVSIKGTPDDLSAALGSLSLACKAHYDWQTARIRALSSEPKP